MSQGRLQSKLSLFDAVVVWWQDDTHLSATADKVTVTGGAVSDVKQTTRKLRVGDNWAFCSASFGE